MGFCLVITPNSDREWPQTIHRSKISTSISLPTPTCKLKKEPPHAQAYLFFAATKIRGTKNKSDCPTLAHDATLTT